MNFTPIKLTIVDFLGVFLPGTVWVVLFATLRDTIILTSHHFGCTLVKYPNPLNEGLYILTLSNDKYGTIFYLGLALVAIILGYLNMSLSTEFTEWFSHLDVWIISLFNWNKYTKYDPLLLWYISACFKSSKPPCLSLLPVMLSQKIDAIKKDYGNNVFPYENKFKNKLFFQSINDYIVKRFNTFIQTQRYEKKILFYNKKITINGKINKFSDLDLPIYQPFESCKRFLKLHAPTLWEEVQYREGQVRLLSSLFLASIFNFILAIWNCLLIENTSHNCIWLIMSVLIMLYLGYIFRLRRLREVQDVYLSTFIVLIDQKPEKNEKNEKNK